MGPAGCSTFKDMPVRFEEPETGAAPENTQVRFAERLTEVHIVERLEPTVHGTSRPRTYWCPEGHSSTSAGRLTDFGYKSVGVSSIVADKNGANAHQRTDATEASICWLPGWKEIQFDECEGFDTLSVFGKKQDLR